MHRVRPAPQAQRSLQPEQLFEAVSIADWLLPLVYGGHLASLVWAKPPWCDQIPEGVHVFSVGRCERAHCIRCMRWNQTLMGAFPPCSVIVCALSFLK